VRLAIRSGHFLRTIQEWAESFVCCPEGFGKAFRPILSWTHQTSNQAVVDMLNATAWTISFENRQNVQGEVPDLPVDRLFAVTSC